jgi:hypothetical protein
MTDRSSQDASVRWTGEDGNVRPYQKGAKTLVAFAGAFRCP